jgi:hypothetical protein
LLRYALALEEILCRMPADVSQYPLDSVKTRLQAYVRVIDYYE